MVMGYRSVAILFWQLSIDHIVSVLKSYIKDVDLPRHAWDTPPFLLIVSPTPPVQSVDAYVRTYARSVTWQPNEKRLTIFHEYGALSHARFARAGAPLKKDCIVSGYHDDVNFSFTKMPAVNVKTRLANQQKTTKIIKCKN